MLSNLWLSAIIEIPNSLESYFAMTFEWTPHTTNGTKWKAFLWKDLTCLLLVSIYRIIGKHGVGEVWSLIDFHSFFRQMK